MDHILQVEIVLEQVLSSTEDPIGAIFEYYLRKEIGTLGDKHLADWTSIPRRWANRLSLTGEGTGDHGNSNENADR